MSRAPGSATRSDLLTPRCAVPVARQHGGRRGITDTLAPPDNEHRRLACRARSKCAIQCTWIQPGSDSARPTPMHEDAARSNQLPHEFTNPHRPRHAAKQRPDACHLYAASARAATVTHRCSISRRVAVARTVPTTDNGRGVLSRRTDRAPQPGATSHLRRPGVRGPQSLDNGPAPLNASVCSHPPRTTLKPSTHRAARTTPLSRRKTQQTTLHCVSLHHALTQQPNVTHCKIDLLRKSF